MLGSTAARLASYCPSPVIIVKGKRRKLDRILVCTGGAEAGEKDTRLAGQIAALTGASITVLHVMSQLPLGPDCDLDDLECSAEALLDTDAREAVHLRKDLKILEDLNVPGQAKVRYGLVVDEILTEARDGDYDLVAVGAHVASGFQRFILTDTTEQTVMGSDRPVLVVR